MQMADVNTQSAILPVRASFPFVRVLLAVLAVVALGLAIFGEKLAEDARIEGDAVPPQTSWLLFGLAAVLFFVVARPTPKLIPALPMPFIATLRAMKARLLFIVPLA